MNPKVSVITPTFNRLDFLKEMVASVQAQTFTQWELCITDDGSTDGTAEYLFGLSQQDPRVLFFTQPNGGQGAARNRAVEGSKGEYLAFLDSDDLWHPEKLARQMAFLDQNPQFDFCYTADVERTETLPPTEKIVTPPSAGLPRLKRCGKPTSVPSSHLYRRGAFLRVGPFDENPDLRGLEDNEWSLRGHLLTGALLAEPLTIYRKHPGQITGGNVRTPRYGRALRGIFERHQGILESDPVAYRFRLFQLINTTLLSNTLEEHRAFLLQAGDRLSGKHRLLARALMAIPPKLYRLMRGR